MPIYPLRQLRSRVTTPPQIQYSTAFPLTENPLSENGNWIGGLTPGLDWKNVQTNGSFCFLAADAFSFDDGTALLTNPLWLNHPNQHCRGTARTINQNPGKFQEVEHRLRSNISAHVSTGYEVFWKCANNGSQYISLARWDGALGSFTVCNPDPMTVGPGLVDGDIVEAFIRGTIITAYTNGVLQATADVSTCFNGGEFFIGGVLQGTTTSNGVIYTSGFPGLGMDEGSTGGSTLTDWGFYNFFAESL